MGLALDADLPSVGASPHPPMFPCHRGKEFAPTIDVVRYREGMIIMGRAHINEKGGSEGSCFASRLRKCRPFSWIRSKGCGCINRRNPAIWADMA